MSQQFTKTVVFAAVAAACVIGAVVTNAVTKPAKLDDAVLVGEPFYPDFTDPLQATALRVAAYDEDAAEKRVFNVEYKDGQWRIPSHHFYPADGEEQLAKTAASVVGIERGSYAGKTDADQKRLGVLDPLDTEITGTEGRGDRITLYKGDSTLVDYIVGHAVEGAEGVYYVRRADEKKVYRARMADLSVSTKFADWIEQDLLDLDRNKLVEMVVDRYHIDEERGAVVPEEVNKLTKVDNKWTLEGIDAETEELETGKVSSMTFALGDLKIVGVRPKPRGLSAQLRREEGAGLNQLEVIEMQQRGFFITPNGELLSNEGEILAATNEGVRYALRFGEVFTGSEVDIEVGGGGDGEKAGEASDDSGAAEGEDADAESSDEDTSLEKSRYVFITVSFDESLLGEAPVAPVKPTEPGETPEPAESGDAGNTDAAPNDAANDADPAPSDDAAGDDKKANADTPADNAGADSDAPTSDTPDAAADDAKPADGDDPAAEPADPQEEYKKALAAYETALATFEVEKAAYDDKVAAGRERVKELNDRFADWYYVISAKLFDDLHVSRADLVKAKETAETGDAGTTPIIPGITPPETTTPEPGTPDGDTPTSDDNSKPSTDNPEPQKPADESAGDDPKPGEAPKEGDDPKSDSDTDAAPKSDASATENPSPPESTDRSESGETPTP